MSYTPRTVLAPGVAWPEYVRRKPSETNVWDEPTKLVGANGQPLQELSLQICEYVRGHPWATCHEIAKYTGVPQKAISTKCHLFAKTGRFLSRPVQGQRGKAFGFALNTNYAVRPA